MTSKADVQHDLSRLPVWARREIEVLRKDLEFLRQRLAAGPDDSDTFADPYSETPRPLGKGITIRFSRPDGIYFHAEMSPQGELRVSVASVMRSATIAVIPQSDNVIRVRPV